MSPLATFAQTMAVTAFTYLQAGSNIRLRVSATNAPTVNTHSIFGATLISTDDFQGYVNYLKSQDVDGLGRSTGFQPEFYNAGTGR